MHQDAGPEALRRSPTGRVPRWALDEVHGRRADPAPWRVPVPPRRRRRVPDGVGAALVVLAVVGGAAWAHTTGVLREVPGAVGTPGTPPPGTGSADGRLEPVPAQAATGATWRPLATAADGAPVRWDPCRPVHWVVRTDGAPAGGQELLRRAVERVSAASGLRFVEDGTTDEGPSPEREAYQPERYGDRWAPVLVTWTSPAEVPGLAGDVLGRAGPSTVELPGADPAHVSGEVELDAPELGELLALPGGEALVLAVVQHELAHLVGLDHVDDPGQLMHPETSWQRDFAAGDLAGLAALGAGPCRPDV
ncbi:peptidase [Kineococcus terrestris]|uniref:peptidase n=1 Tax=Kineococcus terrestris TaxID=2044856 RepID=UPI0034DB7B1F